MGTEPNRKSESGWDPPFSRKAQGYLRAAQWSPGRQVSVTAYTEAFREEGIVLLPASRSFLERFGGLIIKYETPSKQADVLEFCADDAVCGLGKGGLRQLEQLLGVHPLCPIGHYQYGTCMLVQDEKGRVFGVSDETTTFIGESGEASIEHILSGTPPCITMARSGDTANR